MDGALARKTKSPEAKGPGLLREPVIRDLPEAEADLGLSIGDLFRILRTRFWFIVACAVLALCCAVAYVKLATPVYQASATLRIDPGRASSLGLNDMVSSPANEPSDAIRTEMSILKSDGTLLRTLDSLSDQEFEQYAHMRRSAAPVVTSANAQATPQNSLVDRLRSKLTIKQVDETQLLTISFDDPNPQVAATIVNHLVEAYERQNFESRGQSVAQLRGWLSTQMTALRGQVETAQKRLSTFQQANDIVQTEGPSNTTTDRLRLLNERLTTAEADRIEKESRMRAAASGDAASLAALFPNPKLQVLQNEQGVLNTRYAQLSAKFGPGYPELMAVTRQVQMVDDQVQHEMQSIRNRLYVEYFAAKESQEMLRSQYNDQMSKAYALNRNQADYAVLQAEVTSNRELYDTLQRKLQQAGVDAELNGLTTILVDSAHTPLVPVEPKPKLVILSGFILGLLVGVGLALVMGASSDKLQNERQLRKAVGYPMLACVPRQTSLLTGATAVQPIDGASSALVTMREPLSKSAESYRGLRNALLLPYAERPLKTLVVASCMPGEGSAEVAANYAVTLANAGLRVLVVDTDLRCPSLHQLFGISNKEGLSGLLLGVAHTDFDWAPISRVGNNLSVLTAGERISMPAEKLSSNRFRSLLSDWECSFDHVILHSAPLLTVSDGVPLANWVDGTLLVARCNATQLRALEKVRELLSSTNVRVLGVLLNNAPPEDQPAAYGRTMKEQYYA